MPDWGIGRSPVIMRGDESSAVASINKRGGTDDPPAAMLMRILGRLETEGWCDF